MTEDEIYLLQTRSQAKSNGAKLPEVHGIEKSLVSHFKSVRQKSVVKPHTDKTLPIPKPRLGQGRARIREESEGSSTHTNAHTNTCPKCRNIIA